MESSPGIRSQTLAELVARALETQRLELVQLWFDSSVLDRYRGDPDCRILRSNTAGRLRGPGGWLVNFGIAPGDQVIHFTAGSLAGMPEGHRPHWLAHLVGLPVGENFLRMTTNPNACIDDGPTRDW